MPSREEFIRALPDRHGGKRQEKFLAARVCICGLGGLGSNIAIALARAGVGKLTLVDKDNVDITNLNRQIIALHSTVGRSKAEVMAERIKDINPNAEVKVVQAFYLPETSGFFDFRDYDYVVDAVDTVTAKIELVVKAKEAGTHVISSMGAGNKLNPTMFRVEDIYKTKVCPLAKVMRRELKTRGIKKLKVAYSKEEAINPIEESDEKAVGRRAVPSSNAFVPSVVGLIIAGEVIKDLLDI